MNDEVKEILNGTVYCTLATVREDGSPWNVPVHFVCDDSNFYFKSPPGTTHGANIERTGKISIVIIDTTQATKGAVYLHSTAEKLSGEDERIAKNLFNERFNNPPDRWPVTEYYRAKIGTPDQDRTKERMFYFDTRGEV